jgi:NAD+ kinase
LKAKDSAIGVIASNAEAAQQALLRLKSLYKLTVLSADRPKRALKLKGIVVLGGDGFMLHVLHNFMDSNIPIYGMNCGTVGFLMNAYREDKLVERIQHAKPTLIHPLQMVATTLKGARHKRWAFNEVSLLRHTAQAAQVRISIDNAVRMEEMICDGVLVSTPAGSSAYNASIGGPIIPIRTEILALTPISPFRPRRWRGALLPDRAIIRFDVLDPRKRPVNAVADFQQISGVAMVEVFKDKERSVSLLFDPGHSLEERLLKEQFLG